MSRVISHVRVECGSGNAYRDTAIVQGRQLGVGQFYGSSASDNRSDLQARRIEIKRGINAWISGKEDCPQGR